MTQPATQHAPSKEAVKIGDAVLVGLFAALLCSPLVVQIIGFTGSGLGEKRALATGPKWPSSLEEWSRFPAAVDQYANDHFGMRGGIISANSYLRYRLGLSASPRILVGSNGWLYYAGDPDVKFFRGRNKLASGEVDAWLRNMESRQQWLAARGARFLILPAPLKETIYPEYLPYWLRRDAGTTLVDQLVQAGQGRIAIIDVRKRLRKRKAQTAVYAPFDFHWTAEGAFVAYTAIMEQLAASEPGIQPLKRESLTFHPTPEEHQQRDLALMLGIAPFVKVEGREYTPQSSGKIEIQYLTSRTDVDSPRVIKTGLPATPALMVVGDSLSRALLPFLEDTFGTIFWRHVQDGSFPKADIEKYHPDVVLLEVQEAGLGAM